LKFSYRNLLYKILFVLHKREKSKWELYLNKQKIVYKTENWNLNKVKATHALKISFIAANKLYVCIYVCVYMGRLIMHIEVVSLLNGNL